MTREATRNITRSNTRRVNTSAPPESHRAGADGGATTTAAQISTLDAKVDALAKQMSSQVDALAKQLALVASTQEKLLAKLETSTSAGGSNPTSESKRGRNVGFSSLGRPQPLPGGSVDA